MTRRSARKHGFRKLRCNNCIRPSLVFPAARHTIDLFLTAGIDTLIGVRSREVRSAAWQLPAARSRRPPGPRPGPVGTNTSPVRSVMGLSTRSGIVFGASPFFDQLFTMGGV
jgi:hypothetical protein